MTPKNNDDFNVTALGAGWEFRSSILGVIFFSVPAHKLHVINLNYFPVCSLCWVSAPNYYFLFNSYHATLNMTEIDWMLWNSRGSPMQVSISSIYGAWSAGFKTYSGNSLSHWLVSTFDSFHYVRHFLSLFFPQVKWETVMFCFSSPSWTSSFTVNCLHSS